MRQRGRTLGLLGGMAWSSTIHYYERLNRLHHGVMGGLSSAPLLMHSFDFAPLAAAARDGQWSAISDAFASAASGLCGAGAEAIAILCNTMHAAAPMLEQALDVPLLSIVDAVGQSLESQGAKRVYLLATMASVEAGFYQKELPERYGIDVRVPDEGVCREVNRIILKELAQGQLSDRGAGRLRAMADDAIETGDVVLLACTELGQAIVPQEYPEGSVLDSADAHIAMLHRFSLGES